MAGYEALRETTSMQANELEEIRLKTMFRMVEDVQVSVAGQMAKKKLLYLTNHQCASFGPDSMPKIFNALEISKP